MVTIREAQSQIATAKQQVSQFNPSLEAMRTQRFLRAPQGSNFLTQQARLKEVERQRGIAKEMAQTEVQQSEKQFQDYVATPQGKLQYVKEENIKPSDTIYGRVDKGYAREVFAYKYKTPYGEVIDNTPELRARAREAENTARDLGFKNVREMREAQMYTKAMGATKFQTDTGTTIDFERGMVEMPKMNQLQTFDGAKIITERGQILPPIVAQSQIMKDPKPWLRELKPGQTMTLNIDYANAPGKTYTYSKDLAGNVVEGRYKFDLKDYAINTGFNLKDYSAQIAPPMSINLKSLMRTSLWLALYS